MSDHLGRLAGRALGVESALRPYVLPVFAAAVPEALWTGARRNPAPGALQLAPPPVPGRPARTGDAPGLERSADAPEPEAPAADEPRRGEQPRTPAAAEPRRPTTARAVETPASPDANGAGDAAATPAASDAAPVAARMPVALERAPWRPPRATRGAEFPREGGRPPTRPSAEARAVAATQWPATPDSFPEETTVHVTIGRIDVRAVQPPAGAGRQREPEHPRRTLDDFLAAGR